MGWVRERTQRGVIIAGSRSVRYRSISNDAEPDPMITLARNSTVGTPEARSNWPTTTLDRMCADMAAIGMSGASPPR